MDTAFNWQGEVKVSASSDDTPDVDLDAIALVKEPDMILTDDIQGHYVIEGLEGFEGLGGYCTLN